MRLPGSPATRGRAYSCALPADSPGRADRSPGHARHSHAQQEDREQDEPSLDDSLTAFRDSLTPSALPVFGAISIFRPFRDGAPWRPHAADSTKRATDEMV